MTFNFYKCDINSNNHNLQKKLNFSHSLTALRPIAQFNNQHEEIKYLNQKNYQNQDKKLSHSLSLSTLQNSNPQNDKNHTDIFLYKTSQNFQKTNNLNKILQEESVAKLQQNQKLQYSQSKKPSTKQVMDSNEKKQYQYYFKKDGSSSQNSFGNSAQKAESQRYMRYQKYQQSKKKNRQSSNPSLQNISAQVSRVSLPNQIQKRSSLYSSNFGSTSILQKKSCPNQENFKDLSKSSHVKFITPSQLNNDSVSQNSNLKVKIVQEVQQFKLGDFTQKSKFQQNQISIGSQNRIIKTSQYQNLRQPRQMTIANPISNQVTTQKINPSLQKHVIIQKNAQIKKIQLQTQSKQKNTITQSTKPILQQENWQQKLIHFKSIQQLQRDFELLIVKYKKQKQQKQFLESKRKNHLDQILRQQNYIKELQAIQMKYSQTKQQYQAQVQNFTYIIQKLQNQNKSVKENNEQLMKNFQERLSNSLIKQTSSSQQKIRQYEQKLENYLKQLHKVNVKLDQTNVQNLQNQTKLRCNYQQQLNDFKENHNKQIKKLKQKQNEDLSNLAKYYQQREKKIIVQWQNKFNQQKGHHETIVKQLRQSNFEEIERLNSLRTITKVQFEEREQLIIKAKNQEIKRREQQKSKQIIELNTKINQLLQKLSQINQIHQKQKENINIQLQKQKKLTVQLTDKNKLLQSSSQLQTQQIKTYKLYSQNLKKDIAKNKDDQKKLIQKLESFQSKIKQLQTQTQNHRKSFNQLQQVCNSIRQELLQSNQLLKKSQQKFNSLKQDSPKKQSKLLETIIQKELLLKQIQENFMKKQEDFISQVQKLKTNIVELQNFIKKHKQQEKKQQQQILELSYENQIIKKLQKNIFQLKEALKQEKSKTILQGSQIIDIKNRQSLIMKENEQLLQIIQNLNQQIKVLKKNKVIQEQVQQKSLRSNLIQDKKDGQKVKNQHEIQLENALQALNIVIQGKNHQFTIVSQELNMKKKLLLQQNSKMQAFEQKIQLLEKSLKEEEQKLILAQKQIKSYKLKSKQNVIDLQEDQNQQKKIEFAHESSQTESTQKSLPPQQISKNEECIDFYEQLQYKQSVIKQLQSQLQDSIQITKCLKLKLQQYQYTPGSSTDRSLEQFVKPIEIISLKDLKLKQFYSKVQEYYNEVLEVFGLDHMDFNQVQQIINEQTSESSQNSLTKMQQETTFVRQQNLSQRSITFVQKVDEMSQNQEELLRLINQWIKKLQKQALTITQHQQRSQFMQQKINVLNNQNQELSLQKIQIYQKYEGFITKLQLENQEYQQKLNELSHKLFECQTFCGQLQAILHDTNTQLLKYTIFGINIAKNNQLPLDDIFIQNRSYFQEFQNEHQRFMIQKQKSEILQIENKKDLKQFYDNEKPLEKSLQDKRPRAQSLTDSLHIENEQQMDEDTLQRQISEKNILLNSDSSQEQDSSNETPQQQQTQQEQNINKSNQISNFQQLNFSPPKIISSVPQNSRQQLQKKGEQMANHSLQQLLKKIQEIQKRISSSKKIVPLQEESPNDKKHSQNNKQIIKQKDNAECKQDPKEKYQNNQDKQMENDELDIQFYAQLNQEKQEKVQNEQNVS